MFKTKKSLLIIAVIAQLLLTNLALAAGFTDLDPQHAYFNAIEYWSQKGAIKGYPDGTFQPEKQLTKAEFFTILLNSKGDQTEIDQNQLDFKDVPKNTWFFNTAEKALKLGLINKNEVDPNFYPNETITKIKALESILKFYNIELAQVSEGEKIFTDVNSTHKWATLAKTAKKYGIFEIDQNNYFRAFKTVNRGEMANYLYKIDNFNKQEALSPKYRDLSKPNYDSTIFNDQTFNIFVDVWDRLHSDYLRKNELNDTELLQGAIEGLLNKVEDPYTVFEPPQQAQEFNNSLNGNLEGIGVEINKIGSDIVIGAVLKGSPAEKAGLLAKDILIKIDGKAISTLSLQEIADSIRGLSGTQVKISVSRDRQTKNFTITRAKIDISEVEGEIIESNIGYISISTFSYTAASDFATEVSILQNQGAKAFIIDLRNNPGGFLNTAVDILSYILPENETTTSIYTGKGESVTHFSEGPGTLSTMPLAILINEGSASASEIVAAAVKEHGVGKLIGTTTFGKGTVQDISYYSDGSFLKMTVAKWLTPSGDNVHGKGIKPDIGIENKETDKTDMQLQKAVETVKKAL